MHVIKQAPTHQCCHLLHKNICPVIKFVRPCFCVHILPNFVLYTLYAPLTRRPEFLVSPRKKFSDHAAVYVLVRHLVLKLNSGNPLIISGRLISIAEIGCVFLEVRTKFLAYFTFLGATNRHMRSPCRHPGERKILR
jgi:hypothetical protein